eukprot:gene8848-6229_t
MFHLEKVFTASCILQTGNRKGSYINSMFHLEKVFTASCILQTGNRKGHPLGILFFCPVFLASLVSRLSLPFFLPYPPRVVVLSDDTKDFDEIPMPCGCKLHLTTTRRRDATFRFLFEICFHTAFGIKYTSWLSISHTGPFFLK